MELQQPTSQQPNYGAEVSLANQGKRKGFAGARSGLFYKFADLAEKAKPRWLLLENVPGLLNSNGGKDFRDFTCTLDELGYGVSWRILDAKYFGTPQRRRRVYVVASRGNLRAHSRRCPGVLMQTKFHLLLLSLLFENLSLPVTPHAHSGQREY
jgi:DNA-cytosine methyltransferase